MIKKNILYIIPSRLRGDWGHPRISVPWPQLWQVMSIEGTEKLKSNFKIQIHSRMFKQGKCKFLGNKKTHNLEMMSVLMHDATDPVSHL